MVVSVPLACELIVSKMASDRRWFGCSVQSSRQVTTCPVMLQCQPNAMTTLGVTDEGSVIVTVVPAGTVWRDKPRFNIPGSIWLPDTGYGQLADMTENYLRQGLARASGGNRAALRG